MIRAGGMAAVCITALLAACFATQARDSVAAKPRATVVGLGLREYRITVYRSTVPPGRVVFNLKNFGEDRHDVQVAGPGGYLSSVSREVAPFGGTDRLIVRLRRAGTYSLICTIGDHAALGMKAKLKVRKAVREISK